MKNGQLSSREAQKLKAEQERIAAMERRFKSDGHLSLGERAHLKFQQNRASRHIWAEKHDRQTRWKRFGWNLEKMYRPYW